MNRTVYEQDWNDGCAGKRPTDNPYRTPNIADALEWERGRYEAQVARAYFKEIAS